MKFINFAIVKFSFFLAMGIFTSHQFYLSSFFFLKILIPSVVILGISWFLARKQLFQNIFFGVFVYLCFFLLGYFDYQLHLPKYRKTDYSHVLGKTIQKGNVVDFIQLKIKEVLKPDTYYRKYIAQVNALNGENTSGKLLVSIKKDSLLSFITIDDVLLVSASISEFPLPLNPHQFNYAKYMQTLGVYHQIRVTNSEIINQLRGSKTFRGRAELIRIYIINKLKKTPIKTNVLSIIQALILGQRNDIDKQIYRDYAAAGAIHILAVSGLHVGILYFILLFLFSPLKRILFSKLILSILMVLCLWVFAFITGLSPSVVRAVTMFSFFALAKNINRPTNTINTLFLSFFILLIINPFWLFQVGFQLSYLAVFFILWLQPKLYKLYIPKIKIIDKIWSVFTVTIAAQLGIFPLSLYYFHQFPGLFFVTNIVVLPFLGVLLGGGFLIVLLAVINKLPDELAIVYNFLIEKLNSFIRWIAGQDSFLFQDIYFSSELVMSSYLLLIALVLLWKKLNYQRMALVLSSFAILIGILIWDKYKFTANQLIIFHKNRQSIIGYKQAENLLLFGSDSTFNNNRDGYRNVFPIKGYRVAQNIENYSEAKLPKIFSYNNKNILIIDSLCVFPKFIEIDIVLLTFSPKINLERLIDSLDPKIIIADGTNYNSYVSRWQKTCKIKKLPFYHTGSRGAFIIE